jgi:hypothetical protein
VQLAHFPIDYNVISHQNWHLKYNFWFVYYASDPPFLWRLWFNYEYHCEKYENNMTSGFEHYHFPLTRHKPRNKPLSHHGNITDFVSPLLCGVGLPGPLSSVFGMQIFFYAYFFYTICRFFLGDMIQHFCENCTSYNMVHE